MLNIALTAFSINKIKYLTILNLRAHTPVRFCDRKVKNFESESKSMTKLEPGKVTLNFVPLGKMKQEIAKVRQQNKDVSKDQQLHFQPWTSDGCY